MGIGVVTMKEIDGTLLLIGELKGKVEGIGIRLRDLQEHNTDQHATLFEKIDKITEKQIETETTLGQLVVTIEKDRIDFNELKKDLLRDIRKCFDNNKFITWIKEFLSTPLGKVALIIVFLIVATLIGVNVKQLIKDLLEIIKQNG